MKIIRTIIFCTAAVSFTPALQAKSYPVSFFNEIARPYHLLIDQNQAFGSKPVFKLAKVHFLVDASDALGFDYSEPQFDLKNAAKCNELGFNYCLPGVDASTHSFEVSYIDDEGKAKTKKVSMNTCTEGYLAGQACPYDTSYTNACCDPAFKFRKAECSYPRTISSNSCNNKYRCYCDTTLYPYTASNCAAPYVLADKCIDDSGSHYAECSCPSYYKPCDAAKNLVGVGAACNRNGETVYAQCECKAGYNQVCEQFGPVNANDYCLNGGKFYKSCKTCANNGTLDDCPAGMACTLEQCSGKYYVTGCGLNKGYVSIDYSWYKCWMKVETYAKPAS